MKKMRMCFPKEKTFADGFAEYILDCKARKLRDGTIHHYQESIKQIYKRIPADTPISSLNKQTMTDFFELQHTAQKRKRAVATKATAQKLITYSGLKWRSLGTR